MEADEVVVDDGRAMGAIVEQPGPARPRRRRARGSPTGGLAVYLILASQVGLWPQVAPQPSHLAGAADTLVGVVVGRWRLSASAQEHAPVDKDLARLAQGGGSPGGFLLYEALGAVQLLEPQMLEVCNPVLDLLAFGCERVRHNSGAVSSLADAARAWRAEHGDFKKSFVKLAPGSSSS